MKSFPSTVTNRERLLGRSTTHPRLKWLKRAGLLFFVLAVALPIMGMMYQTFATRRDERRFLPAGQLTNVGGYMLHIHCTGSGSPTIILEGGLGGTSLDWSLVQPELAKRTQVCSYDRAGLGWSEPNPDNLPRTSQQIVQELHTLLETTGITGPYILAGLSAGGMHVQVFANQYPEETLGLVLVDPTPAQLMSGFSEEQRQALLPNLDQFNMIRRLEPFGLLRILPLPGTESLARLPSETQQSIRAVNVRNGTARSLYAEAAGFETSILQTAALEPFPSILPVTVVWHGIPAEPLDLEPLAEQSLRKIVDGSERGKFTTAENSGHYITFDRPDVVIDALADMIDTVRFDSSENRVTQ
jgi:pimeloyl-ACP methyl ester carboxylesterase